ncbi:glycoside hydrolase superfamily, partial [Lipomyces starkeyi]
MISSILTVIWLVAGLAAAVPEAISKAPAYAAPTVPIGRALRPNARAVGRLFEIDGTVEHFAGTNAWWLSHLLNDSDVEFAMSEIAKSKYKTVRTWAFGNVNVPDSTGDLVYFQVLNTSLYSTGQAINYGFNGIRRLDVVVSMAEKYNLKLVLAMLNNWDDLGGINAYTNAFGGNATTFFTSKAAQAAYRNYVEFIVKRYKSSSAIFAWELCNEPRCQGCDPSVIYGWAKST